MAGTRLFKIRKDLGRVPLGISSGSCFFLTLLQSTVSDSWQCLPME